LLKKSYNFTARVLKHELLEAVNNDTLRKLGYCSWLELNDMCTLQQLLLTKDTSGLPVFMAASERDAGQLWPTIRRMRPRLTRLSIYIRFARISNQNNIPRLIFHDLMRFSQLRILNLLHAGRCGALHLRKIAKYLKLIRLIFCLYFLYSSLAFYVYNTVI
jgi:hypothetical protein